MGAWIEIVEELKKELENLVAPFMGAWIEISWWSCNGSWWISRTLYGCVD